MLAFIVKILRLKTNWGKSQLPPEIFTAKVFPFCIAWHPKTHQHSVNTGDGDYGGVKSRANGTAFQERIKRPPCGAATKSKPSDIHLQGSISSKRNASLLFSIWDAELVISRCACETLKCKRVKSSAAQVSPHWEDLTSSEQSQNWAN